MRANINLNIHINQVKDLSRSLLANEGQRLVDLIKGYSESIIEPHDNEDYDDVLENIEELREHLADIDMMLAQVGNILSGYHNRDQEEIDVAKIKSSVEQKLQQAEKFNSFLEKISDQVIEETTEDGNE